MTRIASTLTTAGAAALLVVASFSAGSAIGSSAPEVAAVAGAPSTGAVIAAGNPVPPSEETRGEQGSTTAIPADLELSYVPIAPCRIVDTRQQGGQFAPNNIRNYYVSGASGIGDQGGKAGGCGIPLGAKAVSATVMAINAAANGYLRVWPAGTTEPNATVLHYRTGQTSTGTTLSMTSGTGPHVRVKNYTGRTQVVVDVFGYYIPQMWVYFSPTPAILDQSGRATNITRTSTGVFTVDFDRNISNCAGVASSDISGYVMSVYTSGSQAFVYVYTVNGAPADYWVNLAIHC